MRITESTIRRIIREETGRVLNEGTDEQRVQDSLSIIQDVLRYYGRDQSIPNIDNTLADAISGAADEDLIYEKFNEIRGIAQTLVTKLKSAQAVLLASDPD